MAEQDYYISNPAATDPKSLAEESNEGFEVSLIDILIQLAYTRSHSSAFLRTGRRARSYQAILFDQNLHAPFIATTEPPQQYSRPDSRKHVRDISEYLSLHYDRHVKPLQASK